METLKLIQTQQRQKVCIFDKHVQCIVQMDVFKWPGFVYTKESPERYC